jgi:hypothetical protein
MIFQNVLAKVHDVDRRQAFGSLWEKRVQQVVIFFARQPGLQ